jgi:hypothetical protein
MTDWQTIAKERAARIAVLESEVAQWEYEANKILKRMAKRHAITQFPHLDATLAFNSGFLQGRCERYEETLRALLPQVTPKQRKVIEEALS